MSGPDLLRSALACLLCCSCIVSCNDDSSTALVPEAPILPDFHRMPAWSADGDSIYYVDRGVISVNPEGSYRVDPDSVALRVIAREGGRSRAVLPGFAWFYAFSPGDTSLCVVSGGDLYVTSFATRALAANDFHRITDVGGVLSPSWSPGGDWIAFDTSYNDPRGANAVWKVMPNGSQLTDISVHGTGEWKDPSWSPSGDRIVYMRYVSGGTPFSELFVMNADGSDSKRLTRNDNMDIDPQFSPDGERICYESHLNGITAICVIKCDGSGYRRLADGAYPAWSPSGDEIAYVSFTNVLATHGAIWVVRPDGTGRRQITHNRIQR